MKREWVQCSVQLSRYPASLEHHQPYSPERPDAFSGASHGLSTPDQVDDAAILRYRRVPEGTGEPALMLFKT